MFKSILVCLDGSNLAEHILPHVTEMAMQGPTKVTLLEVLPETCRGNDRGYTEDPLVSTTSFGRVPPRTGIAAGRGWG